MCYMDEPKSLTVTYLQSAWKPSAVVYNHCLLLPPFVVLFFFSLVFALWCVVVLGVLSS